MASHVFANFFFCGFPFSNADWWSMPKTRSAIGFSSPPNDATKAVVWSQFSIFKPSRRSSYRSTMIAQTIISVIVLLLLFICRQSCNRSNVIKVFLIFLYSTSQCKTSKFCPKHSMGFILKKPYPDTRPLFSIRILLCLLHQIIKHTAIRAPSITPTITPPIWAGVNLKEPLSEKEHCESL